jgi:hypothetical protein
LKGGCFSEIPLRVRRILGILNHTDKKEEIRAKIEASGEFGIT